MFDDKILKMNLLGGMHSFMMNCINDENLQETWLVLGVPDAPSEEDLEFIAENDEFFAHVVYKFGHLVLADLDNK